MPDENKFVTKESLNSVLDSRDSNIYKRIDEVEKNAKDNFYDLKMQIIESNSTQKSMYSELKEMNETNKRTNQILETIQPRVIDLEYKTKAQDESIGKVSTSIDTVASSIDEQKRGNTQVIVAWITFAGVIAVPLIPIIGDWLFK